MRLSRLLAPGVVAGRAVLAIPFAILLSTAACSAPEGSSGVELTVFAAASLKTPLEQLAEDFERQHDGVSVRISFAGSSDLVTQIAGGAPADVLATADEATMERTEAAGLLDGTPSPFATNSMTIAVPSGNPAGVTTFADLASDELITVVCAPQVPCGAAAERVERAAGVTLSPVSEEHHVRDVLGKVASGEADAGVVYVTDVAASDAVEAVELPDDINTTTRYPIAAVAGGGHSDLAQQFVDLVVADGRGEGEDRLSGAGFGAP